MSEAGERYVCLKREALAVQTPLSDPSGSLLQEARVVVDDNGRHAK